MRQAFRAVLRCACMAAVLQLAACANLDAVRDFAGSSAKFTAYKGLAERYAGSADRLLAELPDDPAFAQERLDLQAQKKELAAGRAALEKLQDAATGYMAAVARLAGDKAFDLSGPVDKVAGNIAKMPDLGLKPAHVKAYADIADTVDRWSLAAVQAGDVRRLVEAHGPAMDQLLDGMQQVVQAMTHVLQQEKATMDSFDEARALPWKAAASDPRSVLVLQLAARSDALQQHDEQAALDDAAAVARGLDAVRKAHAQMLAQLGHLGDPQLAALLEKAATDLQDVRTDLHKL